MEGQVCLNRGEEKDVENGSLWIYDNEIDWCTDTCRDGDVVTVLDSRRRFCAKGFFNSKSKIVVRVLTRDPEETIDHGFFHKRIRRAWEYRQSIGLTNACRVVFGDSDGLPGLTVDKFGDYLSIQIVSLGMEQWKQNIVEILVEIFAPKGIYERNDLQVREKEGLPQQTGCLYGAVPQQCEILEHDARMLVSIPDGQKTGHFLDQQENRGILKDYVKGKTVLDLCCCSGGFSVHAGLYGAKSVDAVDVSERALELVRNNAALNGLGCVNTICENVFDLAKRLCDEGKQYDVVILDPPAFAKSRRVLESAYKGYKELNYRCMQLTKSGGFMLTCSCSQFMTRDLFLKMLREAAVDSGRQVRLIREVMQSRDHPAAIGEESALYLKGWMLNIW
ncbi:MAG: class I SAM-dependent rRNA methyltransferase [Oscillospiraceae bacterium]|nr:class I SAM-dependent rRNA methyltransferase [Oscillospiraceae bacterium]